MHVIINKNDQLTKVNTYTSKNILCNKFYFLIFLLAQNYFSLLTDVYFDNLKGKGNRNLIYIYFHILTFLHANIFSNMFQINSRWYNK